MPSYIMRNGCWRAMGLLTAGERSHSKRRESQDAPLDAEARVLSADRRAE